MQATDFFAALPIAGVQPQAGAGRGLDAAAGIGGLFAPAEGAEGLFGDTGFAEALMAVLGVVQQQAPTPTTPSDTGEGADAIEGFEGKSAKPAAPARLVQPQNLLTAETAPDGVEAVTPAAASDIEASTAAVSPALLSEPIEAVLEPSRDTDRRSPVRAASAEPDMGAAQAIATALAPTTQMDVAAAKPSSPAAPNPAPAAPQASQAASALAATPLSESPPAPSLVAAPTSPELPPAEIPVQAVATAPRPSAQSETSKPSQRHKVEGATAPSAVRNAEHASAVVQAAAPEETETEAAVLTAAPIDTEDAPASEPASPTQPHLPAHAEARAIPQTPTFEAAKATPQTVALLSAQIAKSAESGRSTRFEMQLEPHGLGKVEVKVEIRTNGEVRADLSFENPVAAAELRARSGELQTALERAGFDSSKTQLSFNSGGQNQGQFAQGWSDQQQQQQQNSSSWRGAAFMDLGDAPQNPALAYASSVRDGGVDVRI